MNILVVGAHGTLGKAVTSALSEHRVLMASRSGCELELDLTDPASIEAAYGQIERLDAVCCAAGNVHFGPLPEMTEEQFRIGVNDKLMGQINLVRLGLKQIADRGSFTLISGILNIDPVPTAVAAATVNGALEGFVKAAANELPRGVRINLVSPTVFTESLDAYGSYFPGYASIPVADAAQAYVKSVLGAQTGQIYRVGY